MIVKHGYLFRNSERYCRTNLCLIINHPWQVNGSRTKPFTLRPEGDLAQVVQSCFWFLSESFHRDGFFQESKVATREPCLRKERSARWSQDRSCFHEYVQTSSSTILSREYSIQHTNSTHVLWLHNTLSKIQIWSVWLSSAYQLWIKLIVEPPTSPLW